MSAIDRAIRMLEKDVALAKLGKQVDVNRIEASLVRLRKEREQEFARWLDSLPKPTFQMRKWEEPEQLDWILTATGIDETFHEAQERANQEHRL